MSTPNPYDALVERNRRESEARSELQRTIDLLDQLSVEQLQEMVWSLSVELTKARQRGTCPQPATVKCLWPDCSAIGCPRPGNNASQHLESCLEYEELWENEYRKRERVAAAKNNMREVNRLEDLICAHQHAARGFRRAVALLLNSGSQTQPDPKL